MTLILFAYVGLKQDECMGGITLLLIHAGKNIKKLYIILFNT